MSCCSSSSWTCSKCTFINPNSPQPICQICSTPQNTPHFSQPTWSCKSCTFINANCNTLCEICGTKAPASVSSTFETDEVEVIVGSKRKIGDLKDKGLDDAAQFTGVKAAKVDVVNLGISRFLTYFILNGFRVCVFLIN